MPILESVKRELRTAKRKQERNRANRTVSKSAVKKAEKSITTGGEAAKTDTMAAISSLDKAVTKKILHKNNAARHKSRMMKKLNKGQPAAEPKAEKKSK